MDTSKVYLLFFKTKKFIPKRINLDQNYLAWGLTSSIKLHADFCVQVCFSVREPMHSFLHVFKDSVKISSLVVPSLTVAWLLDP